MNINKKSIVLYISILTLFHIRIIFAQPYIFLTNPINDRGNVDIVRMNLQSSSSDTIIHDAGRVSQIFCNNDQSKLFLQKRGLLEVVDLNDINNRQTILDQGEWIHNIFDSPINNLLYISIGREDEYEKTIVLDRSSYDTLHVLSNIMNYDLPLLSYNQTKYFKLLPDSIIKFDIYRCNDGIKIEDAKRCGNLGPFARLVSISGEKNGIVLVNVRTSPIAKFQSQQYIVCNPEEGTIIAVIPFPLRSKAYISSNTKYVIIEEAQFIKNDDPNIPAEYFPGNIHVFDGKTGSLMQKLSLPPDGRVLVFDNYPNMLYYYLPNEQRSINIDLSQLSDSLTIPIGLGWNMVSVPLLQTDYRPSVVFPGNYGDIFRYNTATGSYKTTDTLVCGEGYWAYYIAPQTVTIRGSIPQPLSIHTDQAGWVMIGSRNTPVMLSSLQLDNGSIILGVDGFRYNPEQGYELTDVIPPGEAVWIYVTRPCTITFP